MEDNYRIGVTGAAGYIGSCVTAGLLAAGHEPVPVDNFYSPKVESIGDLGIEEVDVRNRDGLGAAFEGVEAILHLAAITGVPECEEHPEDAFDVNVGGTENVAWLCREWEVPLVFPCSMAVLGDPVEFPIDADHPREPLNNYGMTKAMSEDDVHALARGSFPAHVYMKSNLYGHHEVNGEPIGKRTVINVFVERALNREPITVHEPGTQARDFVHVEDVSRAYLLSLERLLDGPVDVGATTFPLASGECRSVLDLANLVQRVTEEELGFAPEIEMVENPRDAETSASDFTVNTDVARELIGFEPEQSVERTVRDMIGRGNG